jgi:ETC complex I subunit conserved region
MGWTGSADPMAHFRLMFSNREAAVAYAERQGLAYEVRDSAKPVKTCPSVDQQLNRPMALWPIEVLSDQNIIPIPESGLTEFSLNLAA